MAPWPGSCAVRTPSSSCDGRHSTVSGCRTVTAGLAAEERAGHHHQHPLAIVLEQVVSEAVGLACGAILVEVHDMLTDEVRRGLEGVQQFQCIGQLGAALQELDGLTFAGSP